jgi:hypothetical protein
MPSKKAARKLTAASPPRLLRDCATTRPSHYEIMRNDARLAASNRRMRSNQRVLIDVQFIHLTAGELGRISPTRRRQQIQGLNTAFQQYDIEFTYSEEQVRVMENAAWYNMDHGSAAERDAKTALHGSPERHLNFYTGGLTAGALGWATFPWMLAGDRVMDGVVVLDESLPGGAAVPYNLGITAVHEVGHWLGLYHTFQGGCNAQGDHVGDTPAHSGPNFGEPDDTLAHNACDLTERAPVHNYMNYCDDRWLNQFSDLQIERVKRHVAEYRPGFIRSA